MRRDSVFRTVVITISDRGARGERIDKSGPAVEDLLREKGFEIVGRQIIPDEKYLIRETLLKWCDITDLIVTTGGTGVGPRDVTPDATREIIDREILGMAEAMRYHSMSITPHAMISRAVVGILKHTLIINLPGSPKGATENLSVLFPALDHAIEKIKGDPSECAL
ncbi:MAG: MogA/MoaB family molybdenum cofactor biosynthesis protein [Deltaproteobacteria bacterium]|nr:MogA/MoaB family molybdenum cofactor biosynthesis protein [Deltaproteobacteria bacterium]